MARETRTLEPGDRRRVSDFKNAWRKMTDAQREEVAAWIATTDAPQLTETVRDLLQTAAIEGNHGRSSR